MVRAPCCSKVGLKRGPWSTEEDALLTNYIHQHGEGQWRSLPKKAGLLRCGKSCRLRWMNYLRPGIKRGNITEDEEDLIVRLQRLLGNRWSLIAGRIPNRTDNEIKNHWNTHLLKKLQNAGINPNKKKIKKRGSALKGNIKSEVNDDKRCNEGEEEEERKVTNDDGDSNEDGPRKKIKVYLPKPIKVSASLVLPRTESMDSLVSGASSGGEAAEPPVSELPENDGYCYGFGDDVMSDDVLTPLLHGDDLGHALDSMYDEYLQLL